MKPSPITLLAVLALTFLTSPMAATGQEPGKNKVGPTNGRLLTGVQPRVEFLVTPEKRVELRFVDDANKVVPPGAQEISVTLGDRAKPTRLTFTREGDKLVSNGPIPEGNDYPTVVQIRERPGAKPVNAKFNLNLSRCPTCPNSEYNCKCEDHGGETGKDAGK